ncbi:hypothetical protein G6F60_015213 [Rhizopus arrhizus]|nr:hypothetical protein G6F60_015213 [Rhizopus arrhizus]
MGIEHALAVGEIAGHRVLVFLGPLEQGIDALGLVHGLALLFHQALQRRLAVREICGLGNVLAEELHDFRPTHRWRSGRGWPSRPTPAASACGCAGATARRRFP